MNFDIKVYVYEIGMELPKEGTYFVVAQNGMWLRKDTGICEAFVKVNEISCLEKLDAKIDIKIKIPKLPALDVWKIKNFFKLVVQEYRSEAEVTIFYDKLKKDFIFDIPFQEVSHGSVDYKQNSFLNVPGKENYLAVGTIHSHCDFSAFHSGTDLNDEVNFDGLHVTFGHNDLDEFSIAASLVVNGNRIVVDPLTVLEGVVEFETKNPFEHGSNKRYSLNDFEENKEILIKEIKENWMTKVSKKSFASSFFGKKGFNPASTYKMKDRLLPEIDQVPKSGGIAESMPELDQTKFIALDTFKEGDLVNWGPSALDYTKKLFGNGPFKIVKVTDCFLQDEQEQICHIETKDGIKPVTSSLLEMA